MCMVYRVEKGLVEGGDGSIKRESMEGSDRRVASQLHDELVVLSCFFCWHENASFSNKTYVYKLK